MTQFNWRGAFVAVVLGACQATVALAQTAPRQVPTPPSPPPAPAPVQTPPQAQAPVSSEPQETVATFGNWALRCVRVVLPSAGGAPPAQSAAPSNVCEVSQSVQLQGQNVPIAQVALGRIARTDPLKVTVALPTNVSFPSTVRIHAGEGRESVSLELSWRRCVPGGCFADTEPPAAFVTRLRTAGEAAQLEFRDAGGREVTLPLSLRGLPQALDALAR